MAHVLLANHLETVIQAVRTWLKDAATLTDAQVIIGNDDSEHNPRPAVPFIAVDFTTFDLAVGEDELLNGLAAQLTVVSGTTDDTYEVLVNGEYATHTRTAGQTHAQVATALATAIGQIDDVFALASGTSVLVWGIGGADVSDATDVLLTLVADIPVQRVRGHRRSVVQLRGVGPTTATWMNTAILRLRLDSTLTTLRAQGVVVRVLGGVQDITALLESAKEHHYVTEVETGYIVECVPAVQTEFLSVVVSATLAKYTGDVDPLVVSIVAP